MSVTIIGIDCATQATNTGLARAITEGDRLRVLEARCASGKEPPSSIVLKWVPPSEKVLLALDAPLGWPVKLGCALARHRAGEPLVSTPNEMFRRLTDEVIHERLDKPPLEVGANWIARTAHAALRLLEELRQHLGCGIPLVWSPDWRDRWGAIEVYPAATRISLDAPAGRGSLRGLHSRLTRGPAPKSEHARDAVVCAIAGMEFLLGRAVAPNRRQMATARREGWIWVGNR